MKVISISDVVVSWGPVTSYYWLEDGSRNLMIRENKKWKLKGYPETISLFLLLKFMLKTLILAPSGSSIEFSNEFMLAESGAVWGIYSYNWPQVNLRGSHT